jgi:succinoglycan biosynthesis transport protein ExoP
VPSPVITEPSLPSAVSAGGPGTHNEHAVERRTLRDYYIIVRERVWIALPLALLVAVAWGYYQAREVPMYESRTELKFEREERIVIQEKVVEQAPQSEVDINTYIHDLNSANLRNRVVESFTPEEVKLLQRPYLKGLAPGAPVPSAAAALGGVTADAVRGSRIIYITARHRDPEAAALVANRYYVQFVNYLVESVGGSNEVATRLLKKRAAELQKESEDKEARMQDYKKQHNLISLDDSLNIITDRLKTVNAALTDSRLQRLKIEGLFNQVEEFQKQGRDLMELSEIANHGTVPALKSQLAELTQQQAVLNERYLERHPKMIDIARSITTLRDQLGQATRLAIADLSAALQKARDSEQTLLREYSEHEKQQVALDNLKGPYRSLEEQLTAAKNAYSQVLARLSQTTTARDIDTRVPIRQIDPATPNYTPYTPNLTRVTRTCLVVGALVFLGIAFGLSMIDDRIKSAWDVESYIGVNLLGIIPDLVGINDEDKPRLAIKAKATPGVEAFLSVYSAVKIQSKLDYPKILLVTSTIPGEGKTLVSCNLAGAFARHGRATLLVDCDMRRPMLHRHFNLVNDAGILTWAENGANLEVDLLTDPQLGITRIADQLWLLRSGGRSKSPTEFLETPLFGQFLEQLKKRFDLIVIDSPPVGAVSDSLLVAQHTDEVIYVCRFNRATRKHIRQFVRALREGKNEFLGIVLNGLSPRRIEYYTSYRYYRSYKKYYGAQS